MYSSASALHTMVLARDYTHLVVLLRVFSFELSKNAIHIVPPKITVGHPRGDGPQSSFAEVIGVCRFAGNFRFQNKPDTVCRTLNPEHCGPRR